MYTDLNPFVLRWIILAGSLAIVGMGLAFVAIGQRQQKRALARRRTERAHRRPAHAHPLSAS